MAQRLIVEGNDAIALAVLCRKSGLKPPVGYEGQSKFKNEFVIAAGGINSALEKLRISLSEPELSHIGLIVDANDAGPLLTWQKIRNILSAFFASHTLSAADAQTGAKVISEASMPTIGIWIMPDNTNQGYLEHFLSSMIPHNNELWHHADATLNHLNTTPFNIIPSSRMQKALLHTWLAWQKEPGKPFGQAIDAGYFNINTPLIEPFLEWFTNTFELGH